MTEPTFSAKDLSMMTLDQAEDWYHQGVIGQAQYEGYRHAWAMGHPGSSLSTGWECEPWPDALVWRDAILAAV